MLRVGLIELTMIRQMETDARQGSETGAQTGQDRDTYLIGPAGHGSYD
jgi:hypothetical protein